MNQDGKYDGERDLQIIENAEQGDGGAGKPPVKSGKIIPFLAGVATGLGIAGVTALVRKSIRGKSVRRPRKRDRKVQFTERAATSHFTKMINQGFRVYDCVFSIKGVANGKKISILSKRYLSPQSCERMVQRFFSRDIACRSIDKNIHTNYCKYITFNGHDLLRFHNTTGRTSKIRTLEQ